MHEDVRWLLRWLSAFVVTATVLWTMVLGLLTLFMDGAATFIDSLAVVPTTVIAGFVWSLLACGLYGPALALWPRAAQKWPAIETSWSGLLAATGALSLAEATSFAAVASFASAVVAVSL